MNSGLEWDSLLKIICLAISFKAVAKLRRRRRRHGLYGKTSKQTHHHIWRRPQKAIYYVYISETVEKFCRQNDINYNNFIPSAEEDKSIF